LKVWRFPLSHLSHCGHYTRIVSRGTLNRICLVRLNEFGETRSTVRTHKNVDCLLKNTPTKTKQMCYQSTQAFWWYQFQRVSEWIFTKKKMCDDILSHSIIVCLVIFYHIYSIELEIKDTTVCLMPWYTLRPYLLATVVYMCKYLIVMSWL
jgi:hypothetical protein